MVVPHYTVGVRDLKFSLNELNPIELSWPF